MNVTDKDGWTPLHAAAHWNQHAAAEVLTEHMADFEARSLAGETPFDVADPDEVTHSFTVVVRLSGWEQGWAC